MFLFFFIFLFRDWRGVSRPEVYCDRWGKGKESPLLNTIVCLEGEDGKDGGEEDGEDGRDDGGGSSDRGRSSGSGIETILVELSVRGGASDPVLGDVGDAEDVVGHFVGLVGGDPEDGEEVSRHVRQDSELVIDDVDLSVGGGAVQAEFEVEYVSSVGDSLQRYRTGVQSVS